MADESARPAPKKPSKALDERRKQEIRAALERLRSVIRTSLEPRDQSKFLNVVDRVQEQILSGNIDLESLSGTFQQTRGQTRRQLRSQPVNMVQLLNAIDGVEQEVIDFFREISQR